MKEDIQENSIWQHFVHVTVSQSDMEHKVGGHEVDCQRDGSVWTLAITRLADFPYKPNLFELKDAIDSHIARSLVAE